MKRSLGLVDIVLMSVVAVISLRWIASAASNGPGSLVLWVLAALFFFVPQALAVADLSAHHPDEGGLYRWTQRAFGDGHGFLCGWCYWVNNLLYFPGLLLFVSANIAFVLQRLYPQWQVEHSKGFIVAVTLGCLWLVAGLSLVGMRAGKWLQNAGALGNWIPGIVVAVLGALAFAYFGSANALSWETLSPRLHDPSQLSFFSQMCFALAGFELLAFFNGDIRNPQRTLTRGILIAGTVVVLVYAIGTLGILAAVPQSKITLVNGILLPIEEAGRRFGMGWLVVVCGILLTVGGVGQTMAWFAGAARVPYVVGVDRYLPRSFAKLHPRFGTPYVAIFWQATIATIFTLFTTAGAQTKMDSAYHLMVDMCLILYFIPYCYLFLSLLKLGLGRKAGTDDGCFRVPGGATGIALAALTGLATTVLAIGTSVVTPGQPLDAMAIGKTAGGTFAMIALGLCFYWQVPSTMARQTTAAFRRVATIFP